MYTGHQRSLGINRQGNGAGNHNHHPSGNGKNRSIGNNGGCGGNNSRFTGNTKMNTSSNPSGSSSGNSSISSNTSSNNGTNQSPTSSVSGPNIKNKGHSDSDWNQYCQEWNQYVVKGRQHGRESNSHNATPHIHNNNSNTGLPGNNGMPPGADKRNSSISSSVQGPVKPEVTGVTHKDNYQTIDGEKKINSASDCDPNAMVKPFIPYSNLNRYNSRGNWNNRGGRGGGKGRGFNNSNNRGGGGNRSIIQYPPHSGYYTAPIPGGGLSLPVDSYGGYNFISVAATPFQLAPYACCEPECQSCPPPQTFYSTPNGLIPQYYSLPAAFQYVPVSIGAPGALPTGPPLPPTLGGPGAHGSFDLSLNSTGKYLTSIGESEVISGAGLPPMATTASGLYSALPLQQTQQQNSIQEEPCRPTGVNNSDQMNQALKDANNNQLVSINRDILSNPCNRSYPIHHQEVPYNSGVPVNNNYWIPVAGGYQVPRPIPGPPQAQAAANFMLDHTQPPQPQEADQSLINSSLMLINPNPQSLSLPQQQQQASSM